MSLALDTRAAAGPGAENLPAGADPRDPWVATFRVLAWTIRLAASVAALDAALAAQAAAIGTLAERRPAWQRAVRQLALARRALLRGAAS